MSSESEDIMNPVPELSTFLTFLVGLSLFGIIAVINRYRRRCTSCRRRLGFMKLSKCYCNNCWAEKIDRAREGGERDDSVLSQFRRGKETAN